jgi:nitrile hydratase
MARFNIGDPVRIQDRDSPKHHRVPRYAKGHCGEIERVCAAFGQPESLAEGGDGTPYQTLYRVRLKQTDLWPRYDGNPRDTLEIEVFEHWLECPSDGVQARA